MGTINKARFNQEIAELVEKTVNLDLKYQWQFNDFRNVRFLSNSSVLELNGETILRTFHITYSESYEVPILWFNFSRQTGALLTVDEILEMMPPDKQKAIMADCLTSISQREHPVFNLLFYHFHPCKTADLMRDIRYDNYVIRGFIVKAEFFLPVIDHLLLVIVRSSLCGTHADLTVCSSRLI